MRIADGRTFFYQWDHDQMLTVPEDCTEVHFDNGTQPNALCCAVKEDGMVDVPNILLQTAAQIHAYGWNKERKCVVRYVCLWVEAREKPEDYVYTQTDVLRIETEIANQLQALKDSGKLTGPQGPAGPKGDPGDPAPAEVFIAEYGKTSFAEMEEAYNAGKLLFLRDGKYLTPLYIFEKGSSASFYRVSTSQVVNSYRTAKGNWSQKVINLCDERITGIESNLGDIESALDTIIAIQEELINNGGGGNDNTCPNCGEFTGDGPCPNNCYEMEQPFYVDGEYYTYYSGMTWEDFINSGYNKTVTCPDCGSKNKLAYTDGDSVYFLIGACCGIGHVQLYSYEDLETPVHLTDAIYAEHSYYF